MRKLLVVGVLGLLVVVSACVTINVYFPAAEAEQAAREFVDKVIGENASDTPKQAPAKDDKGAAPGLGLLSFFIADAHAQQADISLRTPAIQAIQDRMAERFQSQLSGLFDAGALGFGNDGLIVVRDAAAVPLKQRAGLSQLVAEDNRDRNAVYREIAVANGHPEWEGQIRDTFARQWIQSARSGWWYQAADGSWKQK
ncbi:YdbL family protein [Pseudoxanthomonas sp. CAU 1598]|uniref:YdbL family protein n=1 Tax=Pseudomarimonas arenosa TaxID=2774145 RepID=A0AAW3ZFC0_9GAMM|nr:YdbL family protein [Pseudomarimonas arenosa]